MTNFLFDEPKAITCQVRNEQHLLQHCVSVHESAITVTGHQSSGPQYPVHSIRIVTAIPACFANTAEEANTPAQSSQIYLDENQVDKLIAVLIAHRRRMRNPPIPHTCPLSVAEAGA